MATDVTAEVPGTGHIKLKFDPMEAIPADVHREMVFEIAQGNGRYLYDQYNDASREIVAQVRSEGFDIDDETLKISYRKDDWSGAFGAYRQRPGANRPAFTIGVDHRKRHPILAPKEYTAGIGATQDVLPAGASAFMEFDGTGAVLTYIAVAGRYVYKLNNWGTPGSAYLTLVFTHSNANAVLRDFIVHQDVLYVAAGNTAPYAYTTDGVNWTESNRGATLGYAEGWYVLNGQLHKWLTPNSHYMILSGQGINGGAAWTSVDAIGDSSGDIQMMVGVDNNLVLCKDEGMINADGNFNLTDLFSELQKSRNTGNGWHSFVWHKSLFYPTFHGELVMFKDGRPFVVTPASVVERMLEVSPARDGVFIGRIRAMAGTMDYLYVEMQRPSDNYHRILVLEEKPELTWRTLLDLPTSVSDELFVSSGSTGGPVLWATTAGEYGFRVSYWYLAAGPDPLQDTRMRYTQSGILFDPWLDMGCPTTPKRWDHIEIEAQADVATTLEVKIVGDDGTTGMLQSMTVGPGTTTGTLHYVKGFEAKRARPEWREITADATKTPSLISARIEAFALPDPIWKFECSVRVPARGATDGAYTQLEMRKFLTQVRKAHFPLEFTSPHEDLFPVIPIPPPPSESTNTHRHQAQWDADWHLLLIESPTREWEIVHPPAPPVTPPGETPILPPNETFPNLGQDRVYVAGQTVGLVPVFGKTENFTAASPTWTALSVTGLPATIVNDDNNMHGTAMAFAISPWARDASGCTTAVMVVKVDSAHWAMYVNTNIRSASSTWTVILNKTIAEVLYTPTYGTEAFETFYMVSPRFTIAEEGYLAVGVTWESTHAGGAAARVSHRLIFHCHDFETNPTAPTWTISNKLTVPDDYLCDPIGDLALGQHTSNRLYVSVNQSAGGSGGGMIYRSDDGGHTVTKVHTFYAPLNSGASLWVPYQGNPNDYGCYAKYSLDNAANWTRTRDGWATFDNPTVFPALIVSAYDHYPLQFDINDSHNAVWAEEDVPTRLYKTADEFQTLTSAANTMPWSRDAIGQVRTGWLFGHGARAAGTDALHVIYYTTDWVTLVVKTGDFNNLFPGVGAGGLKYKGFIRALVPDFLEV